jgi:hypothetical protein
MTDTLGGRPLRCDASGSQCHTVTYLYNETGRVRQISSLVSDRAMLIGRRIDGRHDIGPVADFVGRVFVLRTI